MKKKILIGSIIAVALLLLMPSIPAVQQKTIEEGRYQELQEQLDKIDIKYLLELDELFVDDFWEEHPIFYIIVYIIECINTFRALRGFFLIYISATYDYYEGLDVSNPIIFLRGCWLIGTYIIFQYILQFIGIFLGYEGE